MTASAPSIALFTALGLLIGAPSAFAAQSSVVFGGSGSTTVSQPDPETTPNPPTMYLMWKTTNSARIRWTDRSNIESGFRIEMQRSGGSWSVLESLPRVAGDYLTDTRVIPNLSPQTHYCFRVVAYSAATTTIVSSPSHAVCARTPARSCSGDVLDDLIEPAGYPDHRVNIRCDLHLTPTTYITKRIVLMGSEASYVTIDLNGAVLQGTIGTQNYGRDMIEIRSQELIASTHPYYISTYSRPVGITVKNGRINGSVRIWGMAKNGQGIPLKDPQGNNILYTNQLRKSSWYSGHTARVQGVAPTQITLDNLTITGGGRNPVYFGPGVTNSVLSNSEILGHAKVGLYLDAESSGNTLKGNFFNITTQNYPGIDWDRPIIAIDGSANNHIINNYFTALSHGGIYLYRNCGEGGVIRHQTPSRNHIINNRFYYNNYGPGFHWNIFGDDVNPAVYLGSHDRGWTGDVFGFCDDDHSYPYGSSVSDKDHATHNVVMQNQIYRNSVSSMIRTQNTAVNSPNFIAYNQTVSASTVDNYRFAGCYTDIDGRGFLLSGSSFETTVSGSTYRYTCSDGSLNRRRIIVPTSSFSTFFYRR